MIKNETGAADVDRAKPGSLGDLFFSFTSIALQGFGGVAPVLQRELVERKRWLTKEQFVEDWSVAQITPGANVINLVVMFGGRHFGIAGALAALGGILLVPMLLVLVLALAYSQIAEHEGVIGAMRGISAVVAGMFAATGFKLCSSIKGNPLGIPLCIVLGGACFVLVALFRQSVIYALLGPGALAFYVAYRRLHA